MLGAGGGVGLTAVELGKRMGARVIAAASSAEKLALAKAQGADDLINYGEEDLRERVKALTDGKGVDVVYDPVGGPMNLTAVKSLAWGGRLLVIGFAGGDIPSIPANLLLLKSASAVGVNTSLMTATWAGWIASRPTKPSRRASSVSRRNPSRLRKSA